MNKPQPDCTVCGDSGTYCIGNSGDASDGNAPLLERCDCEAGQPATPAQATAAPTDLSAAIMELRCEKPDYANSEARQAYLFGFITAKKAAADLVRASLPGVPQAEDVAKDAARLDWLDKQRVGYGFEGELEGYEWLMNGPYASIRAAIDAAMLAAIPTTPSGEA